MSIDDIMAAEVEKFIRRTKRDLEIYKMYDQTPHYSFQEIADKIEEDHPGDELYAISRQRVAKIIEHMDALLVQYSAPAPEQHITGIGTVVSVSDAPPLIIDE